MYSDLFKIEALKKAYHEINKELDHLYSLNPAHLSNAKKRLSIPKLEAEKKNILDEFNEVIQSIKEWNKNLLQSEPLYSQLISSHYLDIDLLQNSLQDSIDMLGLGQKVNNVKARLQKLWINSYK